MRTSTGGDSSSAVYPAWRFGIRCPPFDIFFPFFPSALPIPLAPLFFKSELRAFAFAWPVSDLSARERGNLIYNARFIVFFLTTALSHKTQNRKGKDETLNAEHYGVREYKYSNTSPR